MNNRELVADGLVTVREAAQWLGLGRAKLYQMMERGELAYVKIGRARRIPRGALVDVAVSGLVRRDEVASC
jgi:excisionase family DNA binding protein